jgi:hypothetical protein
MIEKKQEGRMQPEIREVLMDDWDPMGVQDEPAWADEYDGCTRAVLGLLTRGADDDAIAKHLAEIVTDPVGLSGTMKDRLPTVRALGPVPVTVSK